MDKHRNLLKKIKILDDKILIYSNIEKEKNIKTIINKIKKNKINNVVLERDLFNYNILINYLNANNINIFDGRWIEKYLVFELLEFIIEKIKIKKEEVDIAITTNEITDIAIEIIKKISMEYKQLTIVTNHINKLQRIENEIFEKTGMLIILTNNKKKGLLKSKIILNLDFNNVVINKYKINENAIILNFEGNVKIDNKRFNGIVINNYEIENNCLLYEEKWNKYNTKDVYESLVYKKDTFQNIRKKIEKDNIKIKEVYGINGKIERFY